MIKKQQSLFLYFILFLLFPFISMAQISGIGHNASYPTDYFPKDSIYLYCASKKTDNRLGTLLVRSPFAAASEFKWAAFDTISGIFVPITDGIQVDSVTSRKSSLEDGLYRITVTQGGNSVEYQAWILHNWIVAEAEIPDSSSVCEYFKIVASYEIATLNYMNPDTREILSARNPLITQKFRWYKDSEQISATLNPIVYDPPASDSDVEYRLEVLDDQFGCKGLTTVKYKSKTTLADFSFDPPAGEAVLEVKFTNNSINYDSTYWFFSRSLESIKEEIAKNPNKVVDSIDFILTDKQPAYIYEYSGTYKVHLITVKVNPSTGNCYDTIYMADKNIYVDTSFVRAPNFFSPNGDGINDEFVVQTQSLKTMSIKIFNRWGGQVHAWHYTNIRSNEYTNTYSIWDGRIGNRMASPGVYFYVIQYEGRDGVKRRKDGFFHLFRAKE